MKKNIIMTRTWIIIKAVPIALFLSIAVTIAFWFLYSWTGHYDMNTGHYDMNKSLFLVGIVLFLIITWGLTKDQLEWINWDISIRKDKDI